MAGHAVCHLADRRVIASDVLSLRHVARGVFKVGRPFELLAWRLVDNHLHALVMGGGATVTEFGRRVEISLSKRLKPGVRFAHVHVEPVRSQRHLANTFHYIFRQEKKHGTSLDPLFEASNLPDLLGMRVTGRWTVPHVRANLPRVSREELEAHLPVGASTSIADPSLLADSAAAAVCIDKLVSRFPAAADARAAVAHVPPEVCPPGTAPGHLSMHPRSLKRLRQTPPDERVCEAVRRQLHLRTAWSAIRDSAPV